MTLPPDTITHTHTYTFALCPAHLHSAMVLLVRAVFNAVRIRNKGCSGESGFWSTVILVLACSWDCLRCLSPVGCVGRL